MKSLFWVQPCLGSPWYFPVPWGSPSGPLARRLRLYLPCSVTHFLQVSHLWGQTVGTERAIEVYPIFWGQQLLKLEAAHLLPCQHCWPYQQAPFPASKVAWGLGRERIEKRERERKRENFSQSFWILEVPFSAPRIEIKGIFCCAICLHQYAFQIWATLSPDRCISHWKKDIITNSMVILQILFFFPKLPTIANYFTESLNSFPCLFYTFVGRRDKVHSIIPATRTCLMNLNTFH